MNIEQIIQEWIGIDKDENIQNDNLRRITIGFNCANDSLRKRTSELKNRLIEEMSFAVWAVLVKNLKEADKHYNGNLSKWVELIDRNSDHFVSKILTEMFSYKKKI